MDAIIINTMRTRSTDSSDPSPYTPRKHKSGRGDRDKQLCNACQTWGSHDAQSCKSLMKHYFINQYLESNTDKVKRFAQLYAKLNTKDGKKALQQLTKPRRMHPKVAMVYDAQSQSQSDSGSTSSQVSDIDLLERAGALDILWHANCVNASPKDNGLEDVYPSVDPIYDYGMDSLHYLYSSTTYNTICHSLLGDVHMPSIQDTVLDDILFFDDNDTYDEQPYDNGASFIHTHVVFHIATTQLHKSMQNKFKVQIDPGANRTITPHKDLLYQYQSIQPQQVTGAMHGASDQAIGKGILFLPVTDGTIISVEAWHVPTAIWTIFSPDHLVQADRDKYKKFVHSGDLDTGKGACTITTRSGPDLHIPCRRHSGLWFTAATTPRDFSDTMHIHSLLSTDDHTLNPNTRPHTHTSHGPDFNLLWHQRLGHPGTRTLPLFHQHTHGVPNLSNSRYVPSTCLPCLISKMRKIPSDTSPDPTSQPHRFAQDFGADFGFIE